MTSAMFKVRFLTIKSDFHENINNNNALKNKIPKFEILLQDFALYFYMRCIFKRYFTRNENLRSIEI